MMRGAARVCGNLFSYIGRLGRRHTRRRRCGARAFSVWGKGKGRRYG